MLINVLFIILSRFCSFSLFVYFISLFVYFYFSFSLRYFIGFINPSSSLLVRIGVGFLVAFVVNFLPACYHWLLNIFSSYFLILSKFNDGSLDELSLLDWKLTNLACPFLYQELHCKRYLFNFNASLHSLSMSGFYLVSLSVGLLLYLLIWQFSSDRRFAFLVLGSKQIDGFLLDS